MRIPLLPFVAGIVVVAAAAIRLLRPHENWSWVAIGAAMVAIACVSSLLLVAKPPDPRRRAFALVLLLTLVPLHLAGRADVPRDPVWEHLKAQIRHDIAHGCPGERGVAARALFETWTRAHRPTTIDCAPTHEVGTYGNGVRIAITVAGRVDPTCPQPRDLTYMVGEPALVLHWCEPVGA